MKVYIIRHGESEANKNRQKTGWLDVPLTEKGREDAALARGVLSGVSFDKIYSSDLLRAKVTAEIAIPGCKYETCAELREINVGNLAGKFFSEITDSQNSAISKEGYKMFGGESTDEFHNRITSFMHRLESEACENIAIFAHAGWLRKFLDIVVGTTLPRKNVSCKNCAVGIFEYGDSTWRLHSWINLT